MTDYIITMAISVFVCVRVSVCLSVCGVCVCDCANVPLNGGVTGGPTVATGFLVCDSFLVILGIQLGIIGIVLVNSLSSPAGMLESLTEQVVPRYCSS